jgi:hypothetical protein
MMMRATGFAASRCQPTAAALPLSADAAHLVDAYDCPAILLSDDTALALETRSALQSLGFDVCYGSELMDADEEPVLVVMSDYLEQSQNRQRFSRIRALWPFAPVFSVCGPSDAVSQLVHVIT